MINKTDQAENKSKNKKAPIGMALGGGGVRGFAHLGLLQAMLEHDIKPDVIAGTSAGAMVGAFIAAGRYPLEIMELLRDKDLFGYSKLSWPKDGIFSLDGLRKILRKEVGYTRIEELPRKFIVTATNLNKGCPEYFESGDLVEIVVASSSVPFIFKPVEINGHKYADGGIMDNLPIKPLLKCSKKIIASNISPTEESHQLNNVFQIASRSFQLGLNAQNTSLKKKCDWFVEPKGLSKFEIFDIKGAQEAFDMGHKAFNVRKARKLRGKKIA